MYSFTVTATGTEDPKKPSFKVTRNPLAHGNTLRLPGRTVANSTAAQMQDAGVAEGLSLCAKAPEARNGVALLH